MLYQFQPQLKILELITDRSRMRVHLEAVPDGILAAIFRMLGIGGVSRLVVDHSGIRLRQMRLFSTEQVYSPLNNVAATVFTTAKPLVLLACGLVVTLSSLPLLIQRDVAALFFLMLAGICFVAFIFSRKHVLIGVVTNGATVEVLKINAGARELEQLEAAAALIEQLVGGTRSAIPPSETGDEDWEDDNPATVAPPPPPPPSSVGTFTMRCVSCGSQLRLKNMWRGRMISCPACKQDQPAA